jgi:hypothetical protein
MHAISRRKAAEIVGQAVAAATLPIVTRGAHAPRVLTLAPSPVWTFSRVFGEGACAPQTLKDLIQMRLGLAHSLVTSHS